MEASLSNTFFQTITNQFGKRYTILLKSWINNKRKICTANQQLIFLLRCRRFDLIPSHIEKLRTNITFYSSSVNRNFEKIKKNYQFKLLNFEIKDLNFNLKYLRSNVIRIESSLIECLPRDLLKKFFAFNERKFLKISNRIKSKLIEKFKKLTVKYDTAFNPFNNIDKTGWLINISGKNIPDRVSELLSLGDNFGLTVLQSCGNDRVSVVLETVKNFENNYKRIPDTAITATRTSVANSLHKFLREERHINSTDRYILGSLSLCKRFLRNNDDLFVTRADKGQVTVVMNSIDYVEKVESLLNDQSTYKKLNKDPIRKLTNKINAVVKSWRSNELINESTYKKLNSTNGNLPRCYGLPKIHKSGFPLRIIVSSIGSPLYNVAQYIHDLLKISISEPKSHIKDGWTFANKLKDKRIGDDEIMISLDVTALFTNIPKDLVLRAVTKRWNHIAPNTKFNLAQLLYAIETVLDSTSFSFNGQFYEQIFGSPMGSPLSPILADIVMDDLETHCLGLLDFNVPIYFRYVDDIFTIVPRSKVEEIKSTFNNYHQRLSLTHEIESNSRISFLNTLVIRLDGRLLTDWYRKPTCSNRYTNFHSKHPLKYKLNTIYNLVDHAILLADSSFHSKNIGIVRQILSNNCFPDHVIDRYVRQRLRFLKNRDKANIDNVVDNAVTSYISLPFVESLSSEMSRTFSNLGLNVVYNMPKKLNSLIKRGKDKLPTNNRTEVVYKIDCKDCNKSYIGQTKRHVGTRVNEHCKNIKAHESNFSVISKHKAEFNHDFDWSSPVILHNEKHTSKREIAEMFFIKKFDNTINLQKDTENLNNVYDRIIELV